MMRFFVVGIGGSGGNTVQFLMERLRREIKRLGWQGDRLPQCWQFLHLDTPMESDGARSDLPSPVGDQDGRYYGFVSVGDTYGPVDSSLALRLQQRGALSLLHKWRPKVPGDIPAATPLTTGASQYRAVGRVAGLTRVSDIYAVINDQVELLNTATARSDLETLARLTGQPEGGADQTLVFIISSLCGGTGSSMVLDVANLLRSQSRSKPWFDGGNYATAVVYTAELFEKTGADFGGVEANSLAAISELVNARAGEARPWTEAEWQVYGINPMPAHGRGPLIVIPVGTHNSATGALFGDGQPSTIFRGVSTSIAAMMLSHDQATNYSSYLIGDYAAALGKMTDATGWADPKAAVGFSGIGMASVDLGRERYREYAAQRIAADAFIDLLLDGHKTPDVLADPRKEDVVLKGLIEQLYPSFLSWAGFPVLDSKNIGNLTESIWSKARIQADIMDDVMHGVFGGLSPSQGAQIAKTITDSSSKYDPFVANPGDINKRSRAEVAHRVAAEEWVQQVQPRIEAAAVTVVAHQGLQVAISCVDLLSNDLNQWVGLLRQRKSASISLSDVAGRAVTALRALGKGQVGPESQHVTDAKQSFFGGLFNSIRADGADLDAELLAALNRCVVQPLADGLRNAQKEMLRERQVQVEHVNSIETNDPAEWPRSDSDDLLRFQAGANEHLLVPVSQYPQLLSSHLDQAKRLLDDSSARSMTPLRAASYRTMLAPDQTVETAVVEPGQVTGRSRVWRPKILGPVEATSIYQPFGVGGTGEFKCASWMLQRARQWVDRPNTAMYSYCNEGLLTYLRQCANNDTAALAAFVSAFRAALGDAAPLVKVDPQATQLIQGKQSVGKVFKFSFMPGGDVWDLISQDMKKALMAVGGLQETAAENALSHTSTNEKPQRIDILSLYDGPYSPLVFSSLTESVVGKWRSCVTEDEKRHFWLARRARQLQDFVPASTAWLQSFLIGWLVGRITGEILASPADSRITVLTDAEHDEWDGFDVRIGVPEGEWRSIVAGDTPDSGYGLDAIPVLLESLPLAWVMSAPTPDNPLKYLKPYVAVKKLGDDIIGESWQRSEALDAWIGGNPRAKSGAGLQAVGDARQAAIDQLTQLRSYFTGLTKQTIVGRDFYDKPRHWELRQDLLDAVESLLSYLQPTGGSDVIPRFGLINPGAQAS